MKRPGYLVVGLLGIALIALGTDWQTNQLMIGDTVVTGTATNGTMAGDRWIVVSNTLIRVHAEATPIDSPGADLKNNSEPTLQLMLGSGNGPTNPGGVKGLHGLLYMANSFNTLGLASTSPVDILSTDDKTRIVVMVRDNGPIYYSTDSGMNWRIVSKPGTYGFALTSKQDGGGFYAQATIKPSSKKRIPSQTPVPNWYAIGSAPDGSRLVMTGNLALPAPVLSIKNLNPGVLVSWPAEFTGFMLQVNGNLNATNWMNVTNPVITTETENQVFIPSANRKDFFRLKSQ